MAALALIITIVLFLVIFWIGSGGLILSMLRGKPTHKFFKNDQEFLNWLKEKIKKAEKEIFIVSNRLFLSDEITDLVLERIRANPKLVIKILIRPCQPKRGKIFALAKKNIGFPQLIIDFTDWLLIEDFVVIDAHHLSLRGKDGIWESLENGFFKPWQWREKFLEIWGSYSRISPNSVKFQVA